MILLKLLSQHMFHILYRPALYAFIAFSTGILLQDYSWAILAMIILSMFAYIEKKYSLLVSGLAMTIFGYILAFQDIPTPLLNSYHFSGKLQIVSLPKTFISSNIQSCIAKSKDDRKYLIHYQGPVELNYFDCIFIKGKLSPLSEKQSQNTKYRYLNGKITQISSLEITQKGLFIWRWGKALKKEFHLFVSSHFPKNLSAVLDAILFNERSYLPAHIQNALIQTGTLHIFSTSGLHITILCMFLLSISNLILIPRKASIFLITGIIFLYGISTGLHPPVLRAIIMNLLNLYAYMLYREPDPLSAFGFSGLFFLFWNPSSIYQIDFQLSHLSSLVIMLFLNSDSENWITTNKNLARSFFKNLYGSILLSLTSSPIIAYRFGIIPLLSFLANFLILWIIPSIISFTLLAWLISYFQNNISIFICTSIIKPLIGWVLLVTTSLAKIKSGILYISSFHYIWLIMFYLFLFMQWEPKVKKPEEPSYE